MLHTSSIFSSDIQRRQTFLYIFLKFITKEHLRTSKASGAPASHHIVIAERKILKNVALELPKTAHCSYTKFCENLPTDSKAVVGHVCAHTHTPPYTKILLFSPSQDGMQAGETHYNLSFSSSAFIC